MAGKILGTVGACILVLSIHPQPASAGVFSLLSRLFDIGKIEYAAETFSARNSQNIALLRAALNFDPNPSKGGGNITIVGGSALLPDSGPLGTIADVEASTPASDQISVYIVRKGDSLSQIADMFGVSVNTIIWANDIERGDLIREGQRLVILPVTGVRYTVKSGDTLGKIAEKFGGSAPEIAQFNNISDNTQLAVGDTIIIPDGDIGTQPSHTHTARVRGTSGPSYEGYYLRPVSAGHKTQGIHGYNAVDIGALTGTPVLASANGTVIISRKTGWNGGYGKYIVVSHENGTQTLYAHLSKTIVNAGVNVVQGQVIGYVGSTGRSTGSHVHVEIRGARNPF